MPPSGAAADARGGGGSGSGGSHSKKGRHGGAAAEAQAAEAAIGSEVDILESGFTVSVHFGSGKRASSHLDIYSGGGEWRHGVVMRSYISPDPKMAQYDGGVCYDIMVDGKEEKGVAHGRCRMVCNVCLSDKRTFRPPPMFCEKCFTAIHQRWSYWEEGGDEGGLKLCKRCYSDIRASSQPNKLLCDLAHRPNMQIEAFIEKKEKDRPEYVDNWVQCDECHSWMHWTCGLYKGEDTPDDCLFFCDTCRLTRGRELADDLTVPPAEDLPMDVLSTRLQEALRNDLAEKGVTCSPVTVRVVSNIETVTKFDQQPGMPGYQPPGAAPRERRRRSRASGSSPTAPSASSPSSTSRATRCASSRCTCRSTAPTARSPTPTASTSPTSTRCATSARRPRGSARRSTTRCSSSTCATCASRASRTRTSGCRRRSRATTTSSTRTPRRW